MNTTKTSNEQEESTIKDFYLLLKPRVMSLVIFSGFIGMFMAPGQIHPFLAFIGILCISVGSGAAGAINMWYDRDIDKKMSRTANRPIPAGRMVPEEALSFGIFLSITSVTLMAIALNTTAAALLAGAILFYIFIYTMWLKRSTPQNIVIGGAAGALPPMIGWAMVSGDISVNSIILFLIIFVWTVPHFWALSLYKKEEYELVNIPMMPNIVGVKETKKLIVLYSILMALTASLPVISKMSGLLYGLTSTLLSLKFIYFSIKLYFSENNKEAPLLFGYSIIYLFLIFTLLLVDKIFMISL